MGRPPPQGSVPAQESWLWAGTDSPALTQLGKDLRSPCFLTWGLPPRCPLRASSHEGSRTPLSLAPAGALSSDSWAPAPLLQASLRPVFRLVARPPRLSGPTSVGKGCMRDTADS